MARREAFARYGQRSSQHTYFSQNFGQCIQQFNFFFVLKKNVTLKNEKLIKKPVFFFKSASCIYRSHDMANYTYANIGERMPRRIGEHRVNTNSTSSNTSTETLMMNCSVSSFWHFACGFSTHCVFFFFTNLRLSRLIQIDFLKETKKPL